MAITSRLSWLPRWRDRRQGRRYRDYLLEGNVLVHSTVLLPHLEQLPLMVRQVNSDSPAINLIDALEQTPQMRLLGDSMSGKRLALRQVCLQWTKGNPLPQSSMPLLYSMESHPPPGSSPLSLLCYELASLGFIHDRLLVKRTFAAGMWSLLLEGWNDLPEGWRQRWQEWCENAVSSYPALTMAVVVPLDTPAWQHFTDWQLCDMSEAPQECSSSLKAEVAAATSDAEGSGP